MKLINHIHEGLSNLYFAKLRSLLALLGILVGTASVVAMVLGGELATEEALRQFKSLGTDLLAVSINNIVSNENKFNLNQERSLNLQEAMALHQVNHDIENIAPYTQAYQPVYYNGHSVDSYILGVEPNFADIVQVKLRQGRFITLADQYAAYCVIGHEVYTALKKISFKEPIGQTLQIGKSIFIIVGVAKSWPENGFLYASIDHSILVPILASTLVSKYATINNMIMRLQPKANITAVQNDLTRSINATIGNKQLNFRSAKELIAKMQKQSDILTIFLGLIGSVSLIVGGIGVMNIMLVSVIERRREIGIRMAVGAKRIDISLLFLFEAIMLSLAGGCLGVVIGILIAYVIAIVWHWHFTLFIWPPIIGFSVAVAVGIFFGFYPAYKASQWHPIEALRSE